MTDDIEFKKTTTLVPNGTTATTYIKLDYFNLPDDHQPYKMDLRSPQDVYDWFLELSVENQRSMSDAFNSVVSGRKSSIYKPNMSVMSASELVSSEQSGFNNWVEPKNSPPPVPCAESLCVKPVPLSREVRTVDDIIDPFPSHFSRMGTGVVDTTKEDEFVIEKPVLLRQFTMHSVTD